MTPSGDDLQFDWRRGGAAAGALLATLILLAMVVLVAMSNQARDRALEGERHAYDVNLLTRAVDASISRAEAGLGRFVLDEEVKTQRQHLLQPVAPCGSADPPARAPRSIRPGTAEARAGADAALPDPRAGIRSRRARYGRQARLWRHRLFLPGCADPIPERTCRRSSPRLPGRSAPCSASAWSRPSSSRPRPTGSPTISAGWA